jgi:phospholipid/cholesterol/gamma-HCH transport system substrate-binding protein/paraquat-inducible protein B
MKPATNFYSIGLFATLGLVLFVILLLTMGGRSWFSRPMYVETYFNESVQGLAIGSAVKYRGVTVGKVENIDFVNDIYKTKSSKSNYFNHYIYVLMAINKDVFSKTNKKNISKIFNLAVQNGMRVHLAPEGLTGSSYLELDLYNPKKNPPLPIEWQPTHLYVPSVLSTFSEITTNLNKFIAGISNTNIQQLMSSINKTATNTSKTMQRVNTILADQQQNIEVSIENMRAITDNLRVVSNNAKNYPSSLLFGGKPPRLDLHNEQQKNS